MYLSIVVIRIASVNSNRLLESARANLLHWMDKHTGFLLFLLLNYIGFGFIRSIVGVI